MVGGCRSNSRFPIRRLRRNREPVVSLRKQNAKQRLLSKLTPPSRFSFAKIIVAEMGKREKGRESSNDSRGKQKADLCWRRRLRRETKRSGNCSVRYRQFRHGHATMVHKQTKGKIFPPLPINKKLGKKACCWLVSPLRRRQCDC